MTRQKSNRIKFYSGKTTPNSLFSVTKQRLDFSKALQNEEQGKAENSLEGSLIKIVEPNNKIPSNSEQKRTKSEDFSARRVLYFQVYMFSRSKSLIHFSDTQKEELSKKIVEEYKIPQIVIRKTSSFSKKSFDSSSDSEDSDKKSKNTSRKPVDLSKLLALGLPGLNAGSTSVSNRSKFIAKKSEAAKFVNKGPEKKKPIRFAKMFTRADLYMNETKIQIKPEYFIQSKTHDSLIQNSKYIFKYIKPTDFDSQPDHFSIFINNPSISRLIDYNIIKNETFIPYFQKLVYLFCRQYFINEIKPDLHSILKSIKYCTDINTSGENKQKICAKIQDGTILKNEQNMRQISIQDDADIEDSRYSEAFKEQDFDENERILMTEEIKSKWNQDPLKNAPFFKDDELTSVSPNNQNAGHSQITDSKNLVRKKIDRRMSKIRKKHKKKPRYSDKNIDLIVCEKPVYDLGWENKYKFKAFEISFEYENIPNSTVYPEPIALEKLTKTKEYYREFKNGKSAVLTDFKNQYTNDLLTFDYKEPKIIINFTEKLTTNKFVKGFNRVENGEILKLFKKYDVDVQENLQTEKPVTQISESDMKVINELFSAKTLEKFPKKASSKLTVKVEPPQNSLFLEQSAILWEENCVDVDYVPVSARERYYVDREATPNKIGSEFRKILLESTNSFNATSLCLQYTLPKLLDITQKHESEKFVDEILLQAKELPDNYEHITNNERISYPIILDGSNSLAQHSIKRTCIEKGLNFMPLDKNAQPEIIVFYMRFNEKIG